jgi:hypothetical protein
MALDTYTWEIVAGDDESVDFNFDPTDVSSYTFTCQIREKRGDTGDPIVTATCSDGVPSATKCRVALTDTQTRTLADYGKRRYWGDLQQDDGTTRSTQFYISVVLQKDVTR